jgi:hypothetical protein
MQVTLYLMSILTNCMNVVSAFVGGGSVSTVFSVEKLEFITVRECFSYTGRVLCCVFKLLNE